MTRLIDADALMEKSFEIEYADGWHKSVTKEVVSVRDIDKAPTIDAVEVVRCKYCIHRQTDKCPMYREEWHTIEAVDGYFIDDDLVVFDYTVDDGFCHLGDTEKQCG